MLDEIEQGVDSLNISEDFDSYVEAQNKLDSLFMDKDKWTKMSIANTLTSGEFCCGQKNV